MIAFLADTRRLLLPAGHCSVALKAYIYVKSPRAVLEKMQIFSQMQIKPFRRSSCSPCRSSRFKGQSLTSAFRYLGPAVSFSVSRWMGLPFLCLSYRSWDSNQKKDIANKEMSWDLHRRVKRQFKCMEEQCLSVLNIAFVNLAIFSAMTLQMAPLRMSPS